MIPDKDLLVSELLVLQNYLKNRGNDIIEPLKLYRELKMVPNVRVLYQLILTQPVTSCEAERSFSCLRRLTTWLRVTMTTDRLDALAKCAMHRRIVKNTPNSTIINVYLSKKKRHLFTTKNVQGGLNDYLFFFELFFFLIILKSGTPQNYNETYFQT